MTRLIAILVIAYAWTLSGMSVEQGQVRSLTRCKKGELRRQWSLFKEGLQYFIEQPQMRLSQPILSQIDDYVENCPLLSPQGERGNCRQLSSSFSFPILCPT